MKSIFFVVGMYFIMALSSGERWAVVIKISYMIFCVIVLMLIKLIQLISAIKRRKKEQIQYYREELDEYSPMINAKLIGKDIFDSDVITAMILYLKDKGWEIENMTTKENSAFMEHEHFFIKYSKLLFLRLKNKRENINEFNQLKYYIEDAVERDMIYLGLLKDEYIQKKSKQRFEDVLVSILLAINMMFVVPMFNIEDPQVIKHGQIFQIIVNMVWMVAYFIDVKFRTYFKFYLEESGKKYAEKLRASKKYLKNYTLINDKEIKSKVIYESYLRNAILFDLKGSLDEDAKKYYKDTILKYGYFENINHNGFLQLLFYFSITGIWYAMLLIGPMPLKMMISCFLIYPPIFSYFDEIINPKEPKIKTIFKS